MAAYRWIVSDDATRVLDLLNRRQRSVLFHHFDHIAAFPEQVADEQTGMGRRAFVKVKTFGAWKITWWIDSPVRAVEILEIAKAGR